MSSDANSDELHRLVDQLDELDLIEVSECPRRVIARDHGVTWGRPFTLDDPLWNMVGMIDDDGPTDMSENKYKYLADAYADTHGE